MILDINTPKFSTLNRVSDTISRAILALPKSLSAPLPGNFEVGLLGISPGQSPVRRRKSNVKSPT